jgi:RimJ/RimL family protein N-acetyltransferase
LISVSPTIDTARLHLRHWRLDEVEAFHALTESAPMRRFLGRDPPSREDSFNKLLRGAGCWSLLGWGPFAVIERATGEPVGGCGLFRSLRGFGPDFDVYPEAGWIVAERAWGRGYATEAMQAILAWFDREHGGGRTVCMIGLGNLASERIAARLGYERMREADYKGDRVTLYARG